MLRMTALVRHKSYFNQTRETAHLSVYEFEIWHLTVTCGRELPTVSFFATEFLFSYVHGLFLKPGSRCLGRVGVGRNILNL